MRLSETDRFWAKVHRTDGCWLWTASVMGNNGYGCFWSSNGQIGAHIFAYRLAHGEVPRGKELDHLCRNTICVNPDHLEPVSHRENVLRGEGLASKNALKTHCKHGHILAGENLYTQKTTGYRYCRECARVRLASLVKDRGERRQCTMLRARRAK